MIWIKLILHVSIPRSHHETLSSHFQWIQEKKKANDILFLNEFFLNTINIYSFFLLNRL